MSTGYSAKCEVPGPLIAAFEVVEPEGNGVDPDGRGAVPGAARFDPARLGHVDRQRAAALRDLRDAEQKRERLEVEQDRVIRELSETDATIFFLRRTIQSADAVCARG